MTTATRRLFPQLLVLSIGLLAPAPAAGQTLRIVSWNTANDVGTNGTDTHPPAVGGPADTVFRAIGALNVSGSTRPIDVLALQESVYSTSVSPTAQAYANVLNNIYGAGTYAAATLVGTTDGANVGNGPQSLVYRMSTVQIVSQQALGTPGGNSVARQVMLYQIQPVGGTPSSAFDLFNDHFKSGTTTSDDNRRGIEAGVINSATVGMATNTPIVFAGSYNPTNNTADQGYHGVVTGNGTNNNRGVDPQNPTNATQDWSLSSMLGLETSSPATTAAFSGQSTGGMHFRDDFLLNSPGMLSGNGIHYVGGSFVALGNTGTHTYQGAITTGSAQALANELSGYNSTLASAVLTALAQAADHLPVVADYSFTPVPEPSALALVVMGIAAGWRGALHSAKRSRRG